jgi:tetratricopeptide (TPR) repeat protein
MAENPRIQELQRRVQLDPASIAFATLAEEYRRAGRFEEAIATCEAGLQRHPSYLSAHVTLGRALMELGRFDEAKTELEYVLSAAPENLAAIRGLAEIHDRRGESIHEDIALLEDAPPPPPPTVPPDVPIRVSTLDPLPSPAIEEAAADAELHVESSVEDDAAELLMSEPEGSFDIVVEAADDPALDPLERLLIGIANVRRERASASR